jgi:hypothetical protein
MEGIFAINCTIKTTKLIENVPISYLKLKATDLPRVMGADQESKRIMETFLYKMTGKALRNFLVEEKYSSPS